MAKINSKVRTTFYVESDLHRRLNIAAVSMVPKRSMSEIVEALIGQFLDSNQGNFEKSLARNAVTSVKVN